VSDEWTPVSRILHGKKTFRGRDIMTRLAVMLKPGATLEPAPVFEANRRRIMPKARVAFDDGPHLLSATEGRRQEERGVVFSVGLVEENYHRSFGQHKTTR
jgi:hypothetical protein